MKLKTKKSKLGKKNDKPFSDKVSAKASKTATVKKSNPFEIRFTKDKHAVIGRKTKNEAGKPGIARAKAIQKRKDTLLQEYKRKNKSNMFIDRRIGEKDANLSAEDKMIARFTAERLKTQKKNIFSLDDDDDTLTHFGKSLSEIDRFEDPRSDDEEDDREKMEADHHFGGFMNRSDIEFAQGKSNSRKEWIEELIADSKKRKAEKKKEAEETLTMTKDLDSKWKEVMPSLRSAGAIYTKNLEEEEEEKNNDPYDIIMREMKFEPKKAKASERLKTDEEIVKEEKEKLERLESERIRRMKGEEVTHMSVDELDDDAFDMGAGEESEEEGEEEEESEEEESEEEGDKYSDLEESDDEDDKKKSKAEKKKGKEEKKDPEDKKKAMEDARKSIPFTFQAPTSYEDLTRHFTDRSPSEHAIILERIIKCNHPQFGENNKAKLEMLFTFLLQFIHDSAVTFDPESNQNLQSISSIMPFLYDIAQFSPAPCAKAVLAVIKEKYEDYAKKPRVYPELDAIIFMKLVVLLFPSSDYRHPVVTPTFLWMSHILSTARPVTKSDLAAGIFIAALFAEGLQISKRFSPELTNFLAGIVYLSVPKSATKVIQIVPPFKLVGKEAELLAKEDIKRSTAPSTLKISDVIPTDEEEELDAEFCVTCLATSLDLLTQLSELWKELPSAKEIFQPILSLLKQLPRENLNEAVCQKIDSLKDSIENLTGTKKIIVKDVKKPTLLKLYEPLIEDNFDPFQKKKVGSKDKLLMDKLAHKVKREKKGAKKEIRADMAFLQKQKAKEMRERDQDRIKRTRSILAGLGNQEGEIRKLKKKKHK